MRSKANEALFLFLRTYCGKPKEEARAEADRVYPA